MRARENAKNPHPPLPPPGGYDNGEEGPLPREEEGPRFPHDYVVNLVMLEAWCRFLTADN